MSDIRITVKWQLELIEQPPNSISGWFGFYTDRKKMQPDERVARLGLSERFASRFLPTRPAIFGWFATSPLTSEQCELLKAYADDLRTDGEDEDDKLARFSSALKLAIKAELAMSVTLSPPGHVDLGRFTTYCHCPRCKAGTPGVNPWEGDFPTEPYDCPVCGFTYVPADTQSAERDWRFSTVLCQSCQRLLKPRDFTEGECMAIDKITLHRDVAAEHRTLTLVARLYEKHATADERATDEQGKSEKVCDILRRAAAEERSPELDSAISYLRRHSFHLHGRLKGVSEMCRNFAVDLAETLVFCPKCGGSVF